MDKFITDQHCDEFKCDHEYALIEIQGEVAVYVCGRCGESITDDYYGRGDEPQDYCL